MPEQALPASTAADRHAWADPGVYPVRNGVYRIPLPLPGDGLRAVNVYAITDGTGLVLVDSGWALDEAHEVLGHAVAELGYPLTAIRRILITHAHRDHYTLATRLRRQYQVPVTLGSGDRGYLQGARTGEGQRNRLDLLRRFGSPARLSEWASHTYRREAADRDPADWADPDEWLIAPAAIRLHDRELEAIPTPGHTAGHVVFADRENRLLFAGDHILPTITPSIGFEPRPAALPLRDYLDSLRRVRQLPAMTLLPGHGPVTDGFHSRVEELFAHHAERLDRAASLANGAGVTVYQVAAQLPWTRRGRRFADLDAANQVLALIETSAHLGLLATMGRLSVTRTDDVAHYYPVDAGHVESAGPVPIRK